MNKALALEVARELKISPEKAYQVCKSFHDGLRELMLNPDECKGGIIINGFMAINFKEFKLQESIDKGWTGDPVLKQKIVNNLKKYKRK